MITKDVAIIVKKRALIAVEELSRILIEIEGICPAEDFDSIKRGVGSAIGRIQVDLLRTPYGQYPELNDLKPGLRDRKKKGVEF